MDEVHVRLVGVLGDQEEFAHLIGMDGTLRPTAPADGGIDSLTFFPDYGGEWLQMRVHLRTDPDDKIVIETKLGNTFTFRKK